ncbi:MAG: hypothetical protein K8T91_00490 [Planctomycetes bacterium]|nr:hypothetical protein [Planctomycetota bacterium]
MQVQVLTSNGQTHVIQLTFVDRNKLQLKYAGGTGIFDLHRVDAPAGAAESATNSASRKQEDTIAPQVAAPQSPAPAIRLVQGSTPALSYRATSFDTGLKSLSGLGISADGRRAIVCGTGQPIGQRYVKVFDLESRRELCQFKLAEQEVACVAMAPHGNAAAYVDVARQQIVVFNPANGVTICTLQKDRRDWGDKDLGPLRDLRFSADGGQLWDASGRFVHLWDPVRGGKPLRTFEILSMVSKYTIRSVSPPFGGGQLMASAMGGGGPRSKPWSSPSDLFSDGPVACQIMIWNSGRGEQLQVQQLDCKNPAESISVSPSGDLLAGGQLSRYVTVWRTRDWKVLCEIRQAATLAKFITDELLVSKRADGLNELIVFDVRTRREVGKLVGHSANITGVEVTSDHHTLVSSADDGTLRVWTLEIP